MWTCHGSPAHGYIRYLVATLVLGARAVDVISRGDHIDALSVVGEVCDLVGDEGGSDIDGVRGSVWTAHTPAHV